MNRSDRNISHTIVAMHLTRQQVVPRQPSDNLQLADDRLAAPAAISCRSQVHTSSPGLYLVPARSKVSIHN